MRSDVIKIIFPYWRKSEAVSFELFCIHNQHIHTKSLNILILKAKNFNFDFMGTFKCDSTNQNQTGGIFVGRLNHQSR